VALVEGQITCLLGHNGAGECCTALHRVASHTATVCVMDCIYECK
jgi:ABC-type Na+ transport system ATPase subunit NatA